VTVVPPYGTSETLGPLSVSIVSLLDVMLWFLSRYLSSRGENLGCIFGLGGHALRRYLITGVSNVWHLNHDLIGLVG
jgi:hypothetical protein